MLKTHYAYFASVFDFTKTPKISYEGSYPARGKQKPKKRLLITLGHTKCDDLNKLVKLI